MGDYVMVKTIGSRGHIVEIDDEDTYEVVVGNARMRLKRFLLEKVINNKKATTMPSKDEIVVEKVKAPELNIVGMRVEEALRALDTFLDRSLVEGIPHVRVIHGIGTGRLMQAVREHLKDAPFIKKIEKDDANAGISIVEFK
ncbi:MAG TPA: Smr/MutS family protein [Syntrophorhabdaceae bacterium]|nr:Smr/MutS family protein [Syntrophorhabdaceae bacterium]